jgi:uncharacterized protein (DUF885 family)
MSKTSRDRSGASWLPALLGAAVCGLLAMDLGASSPATLGATPATGDTLANPGATAKPAATTPDARAAAELAKLVAETWQHQLATDLSIRVREHLQAATLPDLTLAYAEKEAAWGKALRERLDRIDASVLAHEDLLTLALLRDYCDQLTAGPEVYWHLFLATPYDAPFASVQTALGAFRFGSKVDLASYLRLLHAYPTMVEQLREHLAGQETRGILLPKPEVDVVVAMLRALARPPAEGPLEVADGRLSGFDGATVADFRTQARGIVGGEINPAMVRLADWLGSDYRQRAPERIGIGQYPGGAAAYRVLVRLQTGFSMTPDEIHRRGEAEVERLSKRMLEVRGRLGFHGTAREFHQQLRADPRFLASSPDDVAARLMAPIRKIEPRISAWFLHLPKAAYGVEPLPVALSGMTFGYYQVPTASEPRGLYLYNAGQLDQRPMVWAAALIYHELIPGHHFQLALQAENPTLPPFRRYLAHTAFVEGWGEYASHLAEEMGLYDDPYALYGRLAMEMFLSTRLVVDTGLNDLGWTRQQATDYMRERVLQTDAEIDSEILRYSIAIPAQALAYKLGANHLQELRRRAEAALGPRFDVRRFHDAVLGSGSLPSALLEEHINWWITQEKRR